MAIGSDAFREVNVRLRVRVRLRLRLRLRRLPRG